MKGHLTAIERMRLAARNSSPMEVADTRNFVVAGAAVAAPLVALMAVLSIFG
jgi:hypothetical protein